MTLEQLKERIEATCMKHGFEANEIFVKVDENYDNDVYCEFIILAEYRHYFDRYLPNTDLLLEAVDLECRAIKARQSSATNGIEE